MGAESGESVETGRVGNVDGWTAAVLVVVVDNMSSARVCIAAPRQGTRRVIALYAFKTTE